MEYVIVLMLLALLFIVAIFTVVYKKVIVWEYEQGLQYVNGRFKKLLPPGQYWLPVSNTHVRRVDLRPKFVSITGQEVLSLDGVALKVSLAAQYQVADPYAAINKVENYQQALYLQLQLALREIVGSTNIDELLEKRNEIGPRLA